MNVPIAAIPLLLAALCLLEVGVTVLLTKYVGTTATYGSFAIPTIIGLWLQWRRLPRFKAALTQFQQMHKESTSAELPTNPVYQRLLYEISVPMFSTMLLLIPGFVTDAAAFCLMWRCRPREPSPIEAPLPLIERTRPRRRLSPRLRRRLFRRAVRWVRRGHLSLAVLLCFLEVAVTVLMTRYAGAALTFGLFAVPMIAGCIIQLRRYPRVREMWHEFERINKEFKEATGREMTREEMLARPDFKEKFFQVLEFWLSTVLLLVPGFVSDVVAFYFMLRWRNDKPREAE